MLTEELREFVLERDGHRCTECANRTGLDVQYLRPSRCGGTEDEGNLVTLCRRCRLAED